MESVNVAGRVRQLDRMEIEGRTIWMPRPTPIPDAPTVHREALLAQILPAFISAGGPALNPLLVGPPGAGKNTLIYDVARLLKQDLYIIAQAGSAISPNREIDLEDGLWGQAGAATQSQFVVQPFTLPGNIIRYALPDLSADAALTRIIDWGPTGIDFIAVKGHHLPGEYELSEVIFQWSYRGEVPTPGR